MAPEQTAHRNAMTCALVDVLTSDGGGATFGYRMQGRPDGPSLVAMGQRSVAETVFADVFPDPALSQMRGTLTVLESEGLDGPRGHARLFAVTQNPVDRVLVLPVVGGPRSSTALGQQCRALLIEACRRLGMLPGHAPALRCVGSDIES